MFFRNPRPDAFDPETGERYDDVIVFWVESEEAKHELLADESLPFFTTPHFNGHPSVLLRGCRVGELDVDELARGRRGRLAGPGAEDQGDGLEWARGARSGADYPFRVSIQQEVVETAERAREASHALALATRAEKDAALHAMADALLARRRGDPGRQRRRRRPRGGRRHARQHRRPAPARRPSGSRGWPRGCATSPGCPTRSARWCAAARWPTGWSCARCGCRSGWSG